MAEYFVQDITVADRDVQQDGTLKLSRLLFWVQEISGQHAEKLGYSWESLGNMGVFWAVLRHNVEISRLPRSGETVRLETWPMPTTRTAYPRAVRALDSSGQVLFSALTLWVLMDRQQRTMVLPGKSNVTVPGLIRGCEIATPGSLPPVKATETALWSVDQQDLDLNGHVNNTVYIDRVLERFPLSYSPKSMKICYLSEVNAGQEILLQADSNPGVFAADGSRRKTNVSENTERVFGLRFEW